MIKKLLTKNFNWHFRAFSLSLFLTAFTFFIIFNFKNLNYLDIQGNSSIIPKQRYSKFHDLNENSYYVLKNTLENGEITLLGTSELGSNNTIFTSFNFFPQKLGIQLRAFGSAGYQSKAILTEILSVLNPKSIQNGRIVILISPTWFLNGKQMNDSLWRNEIATPLNLTRIRINPLIKPSIKEKILSDTNHTWFSDFTDQVLIKYFDKNVSIKKLNLTSKNPKMVSLKEIAMSIDKKIINNSYNVNDDYFQKAIKPLLKFKKLPLQIQSIGLDQPNFEVNDFKDLVECLKVFKIKPLFVIMPLNQKIFSNLDEINSTIELIKKNLNIVEFPFLDLWSKPQDVGLLTDSVHLGALGWFFVDEFILKNYIPEKK